MTPGAKIYKLKRAAVQQQKATRSKDMCYMYIKRRRGKEHHMCSEPVSQCSASVFSPPNFPQLLKQLKSKREVSYYDTHQMRAANTISLAIRADYYSEKPCTRANSTKKDQW